MYIHNIYIYISVYTIFNICMLYTHIYIYICRGNETKSQVVGIGDSNHRRQPVGAIMREPPVKPEIAGDLASNGAWLVHG